MELVYKKLGFDEYSEYLKSNLWKDIRKKILEDSSYSCYVCGWNPRGKRQAYKLQVHHKQYDIFTMQGLALENLIPLCYKCHRVAHFGTASRKKAKTIKECFYIPLEQVNSRVERMKEIVSDPCSKAYITGLVKNGYFKKARKLLSEVKKRVTPGVNKIPNGKKQVMKLLEQ